MFLEEAGGRHTYLPAEAFERNREEAQTTDGTALLEPKLRDERTQLVNVLAAKAVSLSSIPETHTLSCKVSSGLHTCPVAHPPTHPPIYTPCNT